MLKNKKKLKNHLKDRPLYSKMTSKESLQDPLNKKESFISNKTNNQ